MGGLGVNCFTFVSAWFLSTKDFKFYRIIGVQVKTWIYSIILMLIGILFSLGEYSIGTYGMGVLPVIMGEYWYITAWIGMALLSPFLNTMIRYLGYGRWKSMIAILTLMLSVIPQFVPHLTWYSDLLWLIYCYLLIAGIRKFDIKLPGVKASLIAFGVTFILILASAEATLYLAKDYNILYRGLGYFSTRCVLVMLICSVALFNVFRQLEISNKSIINAFAKGTFGVYLIHENPFINEWLWNNLLQVKVMYKSNAFVFATWSFFLACVCFFLCAIIDIGINKVLTFFIYRKKLYSNICDWVDKKVYFSDSFV